jgi:hypothetical protein
LYSPPSTVYSELAKITRDKYRHEEYPEEYPTNPNIDLIRSPRATPEVAPTSGTLPNGQSYNATRRCSSPPPIVMPSLPAPDAPSPSPPRVRGPPARPDSPEHRLVEMHNIGGAALDQIFSTIGDPNAVGGRKAWVCPRCDKWVRKQDRASHLLGHEGKKRYACRCGRRFGRPQDADRHIREQAPCVRW